MFEGPKRRPFATGLAVGFILAIAVAGLIVENRYSFPDNPNQVDSKAHAANERGNDQDNSDGWWLWRWDDSLVRSSDSLAQWLMMAFTVVAAGLLYGTLRQSNNATVAAVKAAEAAGEANLFLKQDQRPWLKLNANITELRTIGDDRIDLKINYSAENIGRTPATHVRTFFSARVGDMPFETPQGMIDYRTLAFNIMLRSWVPILFDSDGIVIFSNDAFDHEQDMVLALERVSTGNAVHIFYGAIYYMPGDMPADGIMRHTVNVYQIVNGQLSEIKSGKSIN